MIAKVFNMLFDSEESLLVCGDQYATRVRTVKEIIKSPGEFFTINELKPNSQTREVKDVLTFRNFLVELDNGTLEQQVDYIENLKLPFTSCTYSGGKSLHFIISLETPLANEAEYYKFSDFLLGSIATAADQSNKNPNRYSRTPGFTRANGNLQEVIALNGRISNEEIFNWLKPYWTLLLKKRRSLERAARVKEAKRKILGPNANAIEFVSDKTKDFIANGALVGDRHARLVDAVTDLYMNGMETIEMEPILQTACDLSGIGDRGDLEQVLEWANRKLVR